MSILDQLDRAIDGLCPCGDQPRPGSAYCGPDCEPTHLARDSDTTGPGRWSNRHGPATPARWRPDLAITDDDFGYEPIDAPTHYDGPYFARLLRPRDADALHLRLDDGHRWVGCNIDQFGGEITPALVEQIKAAWPKLERQLGDPRQAVTLDSPMQELLHAMLAPRDEWPPHLVHLIVGGGSSQRIDLSWRRHCGNCGQRGTPINGQRVRPMTVAWTPDDIDPTGLASTVEYCHLCPHCRMPHDGPPLTPTVRPADGPPGVALHLTATADGIRYDRNMRISAQTLARVSAPDAMVQGAWDRMAARILARIAERQDGPSDAELDRRQAAVDSSRLAEMMRSGRVYVAPVGTDLSDLDAWREVGTAGSDGLAAPEWTPDTPDIDREQLRQAVAAMWSATERRMYEAAARMAPAFAAMREAARRLPQPVHAVHDEPPTDPMQRALWLRRNRNTGPAPDRLDGRNRRRNGGRR
ncbi:hypothetical protein C1I95_24750 [Micromonospora craterilacus]|uniref:Uncharacterized protein n=1 Tax=Micromonospora craterilacus TaxID=1655439 RepID=A0A2W2E6V9_9ACTN|nr:hypothetical protein [Micromonospora craterilacus]PZG12955.1 hypothetical protein C1I95_24750 [Micromonospora craterilacus]